MGSRNKGTVIEKLKLIIVSMGKVLEELPGSKNVACIERSTRNLGGP